MKGFECWQGEVSHGRETLGMHVPVVGQVSVMDQLDCEATGGAEELGYCRTPLVKRVIGARRCCPAEM
jgi:hypothetical protein